MKYYTRTGKKANGSDSVAPTPEQIEKRTQQLIDEYNKEFANPYEAAERGYVDDVIEPAETRRELITALRRLATKVDSNPAKKHGTIPL